MKKKHVSQNPVIRIKDVALKANVSTGTVDRVIHNRGRVAKDVKERVLKIIKKLNYEPNLDKLFRFKYSGHFKYGQYVTGLQLSRYHFKL